MLDFIPVWLAVTLLVVGIMGLVFRSRLAMMIARLVPIAPVKVVLTIFAIVGLLTGGFGIITSFASGVIGSSSTASIGATTTSGVSSALLERCDYAGGTSVAGNLTARADPNSNNKVYLDISRSAGNFQTNTGLAIQTNFTCVRSGSTQEAESYLIVVKGEEFRSETDATDSSVYNILVTNSTPSTIWSGKWKSFVFADSDASADVGDTQEYVYLDFSAGSKTATLTIYGKVSDTSLGELNNYTQKGVTIYQRVDGADTPLAYNVVNKLS